MNRNSILFAYAAVAASMLAASCISARVGTRDGDPAPGPASPNTVEVSLDGSRVVLLPGLGMFGEYTKTNNVNDLIDARVEELNLGELGGYVKTEDLDNRVNTTNGTPYVNGVEIPTANHTHVSADIADLSVTNDGSKVTFTVGADEYDVAMASHAHDVSDVHLGDLDLLGALDGKVGTNHHGSVSIEGDLDVVGRVHEGSGDSDPAFRANIYSDSFIIASLPDGDDGAKSTNRLDAGCIVVFRPEGGDPHMAMVRSVASGRSAFMLDKAVPSSLRKPNVPAEVVFGIAYGEASHAEGSETMAMGRWSHSEGASTSATGSWSHAEGHLSRAFGQCSHAEGYGAVASGTGAHAEGVGENAETVDDPDEDGNASGSYSHSEGWRTLAKTWYAHSEGSATKASGIASHSEGKNSLASGDFSHAEGTNTVAYANASHAEGTDTIAGLNRGDVATHAEGANTRAYLNAAHAEGWKSIASNYVAHAEGESTFASGTGSHTEGLYTVASGARSHAEGVGTLAFGTGSHSAGTNTVAYGHYSSAEGVGYGTLLGAVGLSANRKEITLSTANASLANGFPNWRYIRYRDPSGGDFFSYVNAVTGRVIYLSSAVPARIPDISVPEIVHGASFGFGSRSSGKGAVTQGEGAFAHGWDVFARGNHSIALGHHAMAEGVETFVWKGVSSETSYYKDHGRGTFNIYPELGIGGVYIGDSVITNLFARKSHEHTSFSGDLAIDGTMWVKGAGVKVGSTGNVAESGSLAVGITAIAKGRSASIGNQVRTYGTDSFSAGVSITNDGAHAIVLGVFADTAYNDSFVWNGVNNTTTSGNHYKGHANGTFNVNPSGGTGGFYIGESKLSDLFQPKGSYASAALATSSANGLMSSSDKSKLDGIAANANKYVHPTYTSRTGKPTANATPGFGGTVIISQVLSDATGHVTSMADRTITIPSATATTSASGLMSSADKTKLNGIAANAQVNQNAFSNVKVGTTTVAADSTTDTLELVAGSNITLTPDASGDKVTIAANISQAAIQAAVETALSGMTSRGVVVYQASGKPYFPPDAVDITQNRKIDLSENGRKWYKIDLSVSGVFADIAFAWDENYPEWYQHSSKLPSGAVIEEYFECGKTMYSASDDNVFYVKVTCSPGMDSPSRFAGEDDYDYSRGVVFDGCTDTAASSQLLRMTGRTVFGIDAFRAGRTVYMKCMRKSFSLICFWQKDPDTGGSYRYYTHLLGPHFVTKLQLLWIE